jgi:hypothetical protein
MSRTIALSALTIALCLAGCADVSTSGTPASPAGSVSSGDSYSYPSSSGRSFGKYGYHPLPYDNTGNGPGETGMEGGGG